MNCHPARGRVWDLVWAFPKLAYLPSLSAVVVQVVDYFVQAFDAESAVAFGVVHFPG